MRVAATVAVGVGVALARAERDRRLDRARLEREREFALLAAEPLGDGLQRIALGQLGLAIELLDQLDSATSAEKSVHETRKALKRLRALIRLLADELGEQGFRREQKVLRDAGRELALARDSEVMLETLEKLLGGQSKKLARRRGVRRLRARLEAERRQALARMLADSAMRARVLGDLRLLRSRVLDWRLVPGGELAAIEPALGRVYAEGRRRRERARSGSTDRTRAMHRWRKRVKDLRYVAELLSRASAEEHHRLGGVPGKRKDKSKGKRHAKPRGDQYLRRLAGEADDLGELLGEEHDLAVLAERVRAEGGKGGVLGRGTRRRLEKLIARRRKVLGRQALRDGRRLYKRSPKKFVRRVRRASAGAPLSRR